MWAIDAILDRELDGCGENFAIVGDILNAR